MTEDAGGAGRHRGTWDEVEDNGRRKWRLADGRGQIVATVEQWTTLAWACGRNLGWSAEFVSLETAKAECERRYFRWWMFWRKR